MYKFCRIKFCYKKYLQSPSTRFIHDYKQFIPRQIICKLCIYPQFKVFTGCDQRLHLTKFSLYSTSVVELDLSRESVNEESSSKFKGKLYIDRENQFYHEVMENSSMYSGTISKLDPKFLEKYRLTEKQYKDIINTGNWEYESVDSVVSSFVSLGIFSSCELHLTVDDQIFNNLTSAFVSKCTSFSDDQLIDSLIALQFWPQSESVRAENFLKIWKSLDDACHSRLFDWSVDKVLFVMDLWYKIRLSKLSNFTYKGLLKISRKCHQLSGPQLIQTLFYMGSVRKLSPEIALRDYEYYIQKYITQLSIEEIALFALSCFKVKMTIREPKILVYIMQRVVEEKDTIHSIALTGIAKAIRFSHKPTIGFTANDLVKKLTEGNTDNLNLINLIHIVHISTQVQFYNEEAITKLAEKFCSDPSKARLKDMERIAFILSLFNFIPPSTPDILEIIVQQLNLPQHVEAGTKFNLTLLSLVYYLSLFRVFPEKQISQLLCEKSLFENYQHRFRMPAQVVQVDYNRVLEGPPGSEHLLLPVLREYLARRYSMYIPSEERFKLSNFDKLFKEVIDGSKQLLGDQNVLVAHPLPHFPRADILFHLDENGNPTEIPEEMRNAEPFVDVLRPTNSKGWYSVLVGGRNMYMHNVPRMVGEQMTKLRQLKLLGYTPIVIPSYYWTQEDNKMEYLKLKYFTRPG